MKAFPTPHAVDVREFVPGVPDDFGVAEPGWGPWQSQPVIGWGAPATSEPKTVGHDREVVELLLMVPPDFPPISHRAQVRLPDDGGVFDVVGSPERSDGNPWLWNPGGQLNLRRVTG